MSCADRYNLTVVNISMTTDKCSFLDSIPPQPTLHQFVFTGTLAEWLCFGALMGCFVTSGVLSMALLWGIDKVEKSKLRAKNFIQNLVITDFLMSLIEVARGMYLNAFLGPFQESFMVCYHALHTFAAVILFLVQPLCSVVLAFDRIYSVVKPFHYNTAGYHKIAISAMISLPWFVVILFCAGFVTKTTVKARFPINDSAVCYILMEAYFEIEELKAVDKFQLIANFLSVTIYIATFIILNRHQTSTKNMFTTLMKRKSLSTAITFFLVTLSSLILYLPLPIFSLIVGGAFTPEATGEILTVAKILLALFMFNSFVDPLIFMRRIPSIRRNLRCRISCQRS